MNTPLTNNFHNNNFYKKSYRDRVGYMKKKQVTLLALGSAYDINIKKK